MVTKPRAHATATQHRSLFLAAAPAHNPALLRSGMTAGTLITYRKSKKNIHPGLRLF
jgi:hypothetical protein